MASSSRPAMSSAEVIKLLKPKKPIVYVNSSQFKNDKPLTKFDDCTNLINAALNFLLVFTNRTTAQPVVTHIMTEILKKKAHFESCGTLISMVGVVWIKLDKESLTTLQKTNYSIEELFVKDFFEIKLVNDFVRKHLKSKYRINVQVPTTNGQVTTRIGEDLISSVYKLIEFNCMPPELREWGEKNNSDLVSPGSLHLSQAAGNISSCIKILSQAKKRTRQAQALAEAQVQIVKCGAVSSTAYNNYVEKSQKFQPKEQKQTLDTIPPPLALPASPISPSPRATLATNADLIELKLFGVPAPRAEASKELGSSLAVNDYLTVVCGALADYQKEYPQLMMGNATDLFNQFTQVNIAISSNDRSKIDAEFSLLKDLVTNLFKTPSKQEDSLKNKIISAFESKKNARDNLLKNLLM